MTDRFRKVLLPLLLLLLVFVSVAPCYAEETGQETFHANTINLQDLLDQLKLYEEETGEAETFAEPDEEYETEESSEKLTATNAVNTTDEVVRMNETTGYGAILLDEAKLIDAEAEDRLMERVYALTDYCNAVFLTSTEEYSGSEVKFGDRRMTQICMDQGLNGRKAVLCMIDMYNRKIVVYAGNDFYDVINTGISNSITDNIYTYASKGDYETTAREAFIQLYQVFSGQRIAQPMRYITAALLGIFAGLAIAFLLVRSKTKRNKAAYQELTNALTRSDFEPIVDVELVSTKRVAHVEVTSGGGGGFHGGGGGGFSGGGGGGFSSGGGGGSHSF